MSKLARMNLVPFFASIIVLLQLTGCASTRNRPDAVKALPELTVIVDSTVIERRSFKKDLINAGQNLDIAQKLGETATTMLKAKGYNVNTQYIYASGAVIGQKQAAVEVTLENGHTVVYPAEKKDAPAPENANTIEPPFAVKPLLNDDDRHAVNNFFKSLGKGKKNMYDFTRTALPVDAKAVLAIEADGKYISGIDMAGNVVQGAMIPLILLTGTSASTLDFATDSLYMRARVIDIEKGEVLWASSLNKSDAPDGANFLKFMERIFKDLPAANVAK